MQGWVDLHEHRNGPMWGCPATFPPAQRRMANGESKRAYHGKTSRRCIRVLLVAYTDEDVGLGWVIDEWRLRDVENRRWDKLSGRTGSNRR